MREIIFAFVDESGKPYPTEPDTHPTLTAVCINSDHIKEITQALYNVEIKIFGDDPTFTRQLKGNKMINSRSITDKYNNRRVYTDQVIDIMEMYSTAIFSIVLTDPIIIPIMNPACYLMNTDSYLKDCKKYGQHCDDDTVLVIFDKIHDKDDGRIALDSKDWVTRGTVLAVRLRLCGFRIILQANPVSLANCLADSPFL